MAPKFGYWAIQARADQIRLALAYAGEDYEDTAYKFEGTTTEGSPDHWKSNKFTLGLPFPNLPYYIDGDVKLSQSNAILRHVGRKHNLYGKDANEASEIDMLVDTAWDVCDALIKIIFADFAALKEKHCESMTEKFKELSTYLGSKKFFMGDNLTIADCAMFSAIQWHFVLDENIVNKYSNLAEYLKTMESDPKVKAYLASDRRHSAIFPPFSPFGNK